MASPQIGASDCYSLRMKRLYLTSRISIVSLLTLILGLVACTSGPAPVDIVEPVAAGPAWSLDEPLPVDPAVRLTELDNGLDVYIRANDEPRDRAELRLVVAAGSALEDDDQRGLAHFLEHMAFNGTEKFERSELVDYLERTGMRFGPDINAYTSFDETVYILTVPTDDPKLLETGIEILREWASGITLDPAEVDKERGVVMEEWRLGRGAEARMMDKQLPVLLQGSRYAERLPIGLPEVIENTPPERLREFYRRWYRPDLMAVVAVGDFDEDRVEGLITAAFGDLEGPEIAPEKPIFLVPPHVETAFDIQTDPEATSTQMEIYYKRQRRDESTARQYRRSLLEGLYHSLLNARLQEIANRPDPPYLFAGSTASGFVESLEVLYQVAAVPDGEVERGMQALLTEVERIEQHGFVQAELDRARVEVLRRYDNLLREQDKLESGPFAAEYTRNFLEDEPIPGVTIEVDIATTVLPGVTLEEVNRVAAEWIGDSSQVVLVKAPESSKDRLPTEARIAAIFGEVQATPLDPWVDRTRDEPLLAERPEPGPVVEETVIEELGVTEWTLANGAKVILKPTDFQNDEILLGGFSAGGTSLASDEDWPSASMAVTLVSAGGVGEFDRVELEKALAGKLGGAGVEVDELEETVRGRTSGDDMETMFQMLYLRFTAPRRDPAAFSSLMTRFEALIANRLEDPQVVFADRWGQVVSQSHPRRRPPTEEFLAEIDLDRAMAFYEDRFADASDFTFFLVGSFELDGIRPLVERYIGGLPAIGREETWRDIGLEPPDGVVEFEVRKGLEPKSQVQMMFHGEAEYSLESLHLASSLGQALRLRLREVLREDLGNTYGVSVGSALVLRPDRGYRSTIGFGCAPESVEESLAVIEAELEVFRADGPDESVVAKVKEQQRRQRETSLRENRFWAGVLAAYYRRGDDPRRILAYDELVEGVTSERLRDAARIYFAPERVVVGVLYPEGYE